MIPYNCLWFHIILLDNLAIWLQDSLTQLRTHVLHRVEEIQLGPDTLCDAVTSRCDVTASHLTCTCVYQSGTSVTSVRRSSAESGYTARSVMTLTSVSAVTRRERNFTEAIPLITRWSAFLWWHVSYSSFILINCTTQVILELLSIILSFRIVQFLYVL